MVHGRGRRGRRNDRLDVVAGHGDVVRRADNTSRLAYKVCKSDPDKPRGLG